MAAIYLKSVGARMFTDFHHNFPTYVKVNSVISCISFLSQSLLLFKEKDALENNQIINFKFFLK